MRRQSIVLLAGALGLLAVGCTSAEESTPDVSTEPSPVAKEEPVAAQPFAQPLISQKPDAEGENADGTKTNNKADKVAGLLDSTDPDEQAKKVQAQIRSRAGLDPFASLPPILTFSTPVNGGNNGGGGLTSSGTARSGGSSRTPLGRLRAGSGRSGGRTLISSRRGSSRGGSAKGAVPSIPEFPKVAEVSRPQPIAKKPPVGSNATGPNPGLQPLPEIPEPTLAKSVEVTGVVTIAGITKAIIKAPNEPTGRHVEVGQRLSNGQVLVKRIEANSGSDPIVIFEQNGVEVARSVGEKPDGKSPTA